MSKKQKNQATIVQTDVAEPIEEGMNIRSEQTKGKSPISKKCPLMCWDIFSLNKHKDYRDDG